MQKHIINICVITKLKNRYGQADLSKGLGFYGEIGMFKELPKPEEINNYEPYLELGDIPEKSSDDLQVDVSNENLFTL